MSDNNNIYVQNIERENFVPFGVTDVELISYALDEAGILGKSTLINGKSAREMAQGFYSKRNAFRQNTRLGHLLMSEDVITKDNLIQALTYHVKNEVPLGQALIDLKLCTKEHIDQALERQANLRQQLKY